MIPYPRNSGLNIFKYYISTVFPETGYNDYKSSGCYSDYQLEPADLF